MTKILILISFVLGFVKGWTPYDDYGNYYRYAEGGAVSSTSGADDLTIGARLQRIGDAAHSESLEHIKGNIQKLLGGRELPSDLLEPILTSGRNEIPQETQAPWSLVLDTPTELDYVYELITQSVGSLDPEAKAIRDQIATYIKAGHQTDHLYGSEMLQKLFPTRTSKDTQVSRSLKSEIFGKDKEIFQSDTTVPNYPQYPLPIYYPIELGYPRRDNITLASNVFTPGFITFNITRSSSINVRPSRTFSRLTTSLPGPAKTTFLKNTRVFTPAFVAFNVTRSSRVNIEPSGTFKILIRPLKIPVRTILLMKTPTRTPSTKIVPKLTQTEAPSSVEPFPPTQLQSTVLPNQPLTSTVFENPFTLEPSKLLRKKTQPPPSATTILGTVCGIKDINDYTCFDVVKYAVEDLRFLVSYYTKHENERIIARTPPLTTSTTSPSWQTPTHNNTDTTATDASTTTITATPETPGTTTTTPTTITATPETPGTTTTTPTPTTIITTTARCTDAEGYRIRCTKRPTPKKTKRPRKTTTTKPRTSTTTTAATEDGKTVVKPTTTEEPDETDEPTTTTTTEPSDIDKLLMILDNLTYIYETDLVQRMKEKLHKEGYPYCPSTKTTPQPTSTTEEAPPEANLTGTVMMKCYVCGLEASGIPRNSECADAFASDFFPIMPVDLTNRRKIDEFRKYCKYLHRPRYHLNGTNNRLMWGQWTRGCSVRWIDLSGVYTQRSCRNRGRPVLGKHFASKRMAKLELALNKVDDGCIISPQASLLPFSRGISLYARFHACVCSTKYCNRAERLSSLSLWNTLVFATVVSLYV